MGSLGEYKLGLPSLNQLSAVEEVFDLAGQFWNTVNFITYHIFEHHRHININAYDFSNVLIITLLLQVFLDEFSGFFHFQIKVIFR